MAEFVNTRLDKGSSTILKGSTPKRVEMRSSSKEDEDIVRSTK